jgi:hypothetical protein
MRLPRRVFVHYPPKRFLQTRIPPPHSQELATLLTTFNGLPPRLTPLSTLLSFGSPLTSSSIILSASYLLEELPRRLVQRVRSMESLPYVRILDLQKYVYTLADHDVDCRNESLHCTCLEFISSIISRRGHCKASNRHQIKFGFYQTFGRACAESF